MTTAEKEVNNFSPIDWNNPAIPSIPSITLKLMDILNSKDASPGDVAELIRQDPALTIKVLRVVNSAFYGLNTEVTSVRHATVLLGQDEVLRVALASVLSQRFLDVPAGVRQAATKLWAHSVAVAVLAQDFEVEGGENPDLYTLGLLHDIGWLLILSQVPDLYNALSDEREISLIELEDAWGVNHRLWGAKLSEQWELPEPFQVVAANHHDPLSVIGPPDYMLFITLANHLAHKIGFNPLEYHIEPMDSSLLEKLHLDHEAFQDMESAALQEKDRIEDLINRLIR